MSLAYKPSGPIPGYKPMGFYVGWAYMRGNRVFVLQETQSESWNECSFFSNLIFLLFQKQNVTGR